jgi:hypothetical protein
VGGVSSVGGAVPSSTSFLIESQRAARGSAVKLFKKLKMLCALQNNKEKDI